MTEVTPKSVDRDEFGLNDARARGKALNENRYGEYVVVQTQGVGDHAKSQLFRARADSPEEIKKLREDVIAFLDELVPSE